MTARFANLPLLLLATFPAVAQDGGLAADAPRYSLIAARSASSVQTDQWPDCGDSLCMDRVSAGGFSGVTTLAGLDLGEDFGAALVTHQRLDRTGVLAIVRTDADGGHVVVNFARSSQGGEACLPVGELDRYGLTNAPLDWRHDYACYTVEGQGDALPPVPVPEDIYPAIIEVWPLDGEYDGYYCPPDPEGDDICLGASILIQKGSLSRLLGATLGRADPRIQAASGRDTDGQFIRFRMIGGHAMRRIPAGRYVAVIEPTDEAYVFVQWRQAYRGGRACFPADVAAHYGERLGLTGVTINDDGETCVDPG